MFKFNTNEQSGFLLQFWGRVIYNGKFLVLINNNIDFLVQLLQNYCLYKLLELFGLLMQRIELGHLSVILNESGDEFLWAWRENVVLVLGNQREEPWSFDFINFARNIND